MHEIVTDATDENINCNLMATYPPPSNFTLSLVPEVAPGPHAQITAVRVSIEGVVNPFSNRFIGANSRQADGGFAGDPTLIEFVPGSTITAEFRPGADADIQQSQLTCTNLQTNTPITLQAVSVDGGLDATIATPAADIECTYTMFPPVVAPRKLTVQNRVAAGANAVATPFSVTVTGATRDFSRDLPANQVATSGGFESTVSSGIRFGANAELTILHTFEGEFESVTMECTNAAGQRLDVAPSVTSVSATSTLTPPNDSGDVACLLTVTYQPPTTHSLTLQTVVEAGLGAVATPFKANVTGTTTPFSDDLPADQPSNGGFVSAVTAPIEFTSGAEIRIELSFDNETLDDDTIVCTAGGVELPLRGESSATGSIRIQTLTAPRGDVVCVFTVRYVVPTLPPGTARLQLVQVANGGQGTFAFESSAFASALTLTTTRTKAREESEIIELASGTIAIQQRHPAGFRLRSATCTAQVANSRSVTDAGATANLKAASLSVTLTPGSLHVCTFINGSHKDETEKLVRNFLRKRAALLTEDTGRVRLLERRGARPALAAEGDGNRGNVSGRVSLGVRKGFDAWASATVRYHGRGDNAQGAGRFALLRAGVDYASGRSLVGVMAQYDYLESKTDTSTVSGKGYMVGPYAEYAVTDNLVIDAKALWGKASNEVSPDRIIKDGFNSTRYLLSARVTGSWQIASGAESIWLLQPSAEAVWFSERSQSFTNAEGAPIDSQRAQVGRLNFGPELVYRTVTSSGVVIEPRGAVRGLWQFAGDDIPGNELQLRLEAGVKLQAPGGASVSLDGNLTGRDTAGGRLQVTVPFN